MCVHDVYVCMCVHVSVHVCVRYQTIIHPDAVKRQEKELEGLEDLHGLLKNALNNLHHFVLHDGDHMMVRVSISLGTRP